MPTKAVYGMFNESLEIGEHTNSSGLVSIPERYGLGGEFEGIGIDVMTSAKNELPRLL